jgi:hypothetical protein
MKMLELEQEHIAKEEARECIQCSNIAKSIAGDTKKKFQENSVRGNVEAFVVFKKLLKKFQNIDSKRFP